MGKTFYILILNCITFPHLYILSLQTGYSKENFIHITIIFTYFINQLTFHYQNDYNYDIQITLTFLKNKSASILLQAIRLIQKSKITTILLSIL